MKELSDLAKSVPRPEHAATFDQLVPRVICQQFRSNVTVRDHCRQQSKFPAGWKFPMHNTVLRAVTATR